MGPERTEREVAAQIADSMIAHDLRRRAMDEARRHHTMNGVWPDVLITGDIINGELAGQRYIVPEPNRIVRATPRRSFLDVEDQFRRLNGQSSGRGEGLLSSHAMEHFWACVHERHRTDGHWPDEHVVDQLFNSAYDGNYPAPVLTEQPPATGPGESLEGWESHPAIEELFLLFKGERNREVLRNWFTKNIYVERCERRADGHMYTQLGILGEMRGEVFVEPDHLAPTIGYIEERDQYVGENVADSIRYSVGIAALQEEVNRMAAAQLRAERQNVNPIIITREDSEAFFR